MANWSERELEDWLWEHPEALGCAHGPSEHFELIDRQTVFPWGRLDLLGIVRGVKGARIVIVELKARKATRRDVGQAMMYANAFECMMDNIPRKDFLHIDNDWPLQSLLVAPEFSKRALRCIPSQPMIDCFSVRETIGYSGWFVLDRYVTADWGSIMREVPPEALVSALRQSRGAQAG